MLDTWSAASSTPGHSSVPVKIGTSTLSQVGTVVYEWKNGGNGKCKGWWEETKITCANNEWRVDFFENENVEGTPRISTCYQNIDFDWKTQGPPELVSGISDKFSMRATTWSHFDAGNYKVTANSNDGSRAFIDGTTVLDGWDGCANCESETVPISYGSHKVVYEYKDVSGSAAAKISWRSVELECHDGQWKVDFFQSTDLSGAASDSQCLQTLDFNWAGDRPSGWHSFSLRATGKQYFKQDNYRFWTYGEDGTKIKFEGTPVVDSWNSKTTSNVQGRLAGQHSDMVSVAEGWHEVVYEQSEKGSHALGRVWWEAESANPANSHHSFNLNPTILDNAQEVFTASKQDISWVLPEPGKGCVYFKASTNNNEGPVVGLFQDTNTQPQDNQFVLVKFSGSPDKQNIIQQGKDGVVLSAAGRSLDFSGNQQKDLWVCVNGRYTVSAGIGARGSDLTQLVSYNKGGSDLISGARFFGISSQSGQTKYFRIEVDDLNVER